jgi:hypothetical protein
MKRKDNFDSRRWMPQVSLVRQHNFPSFRSSISAKAARGRRKIFVVEQVMERGNASASRANVRRILIFDNHPESLRLVFHGRRGGLADDENPASAKWLEVVGASFLMVAAILGMFWPLL